MPATNGPWTILQSRKEFTNEHLELIVDDVVRPDGEQGNYAVVALKDGVLVLAVDEEGNAWLSKQFRYAIGSDSLEAVGGGISDGEAPLDAAKRELREELGIDAEELTDLGPLHLATSMIRTTTTLYLARLLKFEEPDPEGSEQIERISLRLDQAVDQALDGTITHAPTCVLILRAMRAMQNEGI